LFNLGSSNCPDATNVAITVNMITSKPGDPGYQFLWESQTEDMYVDSGRNSNELPHKLTILTPAFPAAPEV